MPRDYPDALGFSIVLAISRQYSIYSRSWKWTLCFLNWPLCFLKWTPRKILYYLCCFTLTHSLAVVDSICSPYMQFGAVI
jgi:hypothetical protein